ncbi:MAG: (deoxy)nucleoside triphosphate pyrophosphohydrolase [Acidobacteriota bacterium]|nr:(deoxy)nucleoside triphosphate pyrophosphohydrolase [Acidobacteriota bacterium]
MDGLETIIVAAAVIRRGEVYLLTRRRAGSHMAGYWEFPGGKVEAGENPAQALERELAEEVGLTVQAGREICRLEHDYPERRVRLHFLEAVVVQGEARPLEVAEVGWFTPREMKQLPLLPADDPVVALLGRREEGAGSV